MSLGPDLGEAWAGMVVRHAVTRSVRDSAAVLDVISRPMPGDPYFAPPPARPFAAEVGADAGRLRIGVRTVAPGAMAATDDECVDAARDAADLLASLGHHVEDASPAALDDEALMVHFTTILTTSVVEDVRTAGLAVGRDLTAADVEPLTWQYYEAGLQNQAVQYLEALNALHAWTRDVAWWWAPTEDGGAGFDLLLTPTLAEPPPRIGDVVGTLATPRRST